MKTRSLIRRSVASVLFAQIVCAALLCAAALLHEEHTRFRAFDTRLQGRSDSLLGAVQDAEDPDDNVKIDPAELKLPEEDAYAVYNQGGRSLGGSSGAPSALVDRGDNGFRDASFAGKRYRVFQRDALRIIDRAEYGGVGLWRPITIVYAAPEGRVWHEIFEAAKFYLLTILVVSALAAVLVALLLRRAFSPLAELAEATSHLSAPALQFSPPASALRLRELRPLTDVLNDSVTRLRESFSRERQFFGDAAHELKTAISILLSSAQLLMMKRRTEEEYVQGVGRIVEDTHRLEMLVSQMLQLDQAVISNADADTRYTDISEIVRSVAKALDPVAQRAGVNLTLALDRSEPVRIGQRSAEILVSNLVSNAIQYSDPGSSVVISVRFTSNRDIALTVSDQGVGIGTEALPHIFDRFFREDRSRSRETGGSGLGLAISKSIVEAAHGSIRAESVKGSGTTMIVTFTTD